MFARAAEKLVESVSLLVSCLHDERRIFFGSHGHESREELSIVVALQVFSNLSGLTGIGW